MSPRHGIALDALAIIAIVVLACARLLTGTEALGAILVVAVGRHPRPPSSGGGDGGTGALVPASGVATLFAVLVSPLLSARSLLARIVVRPPATAPHP